MKDKQVLRKELNRIDGKSYGAYKGLSKSTYEFENFNLFFEYVQGDPFASPSNIIVYVPQEKAKFPEDTYKAINNLKGIGKSREIALRDFLTRLFYSNARKYSKGNRGSGKSGRISIDNPGQEILERTSVFVDQGRGVEIRFSVGLPAMGRRIAGKHALEMFFKEIPKIVENSLFFENLDKETKEKLYSQVKVNEDADYLRNELKNRGLIAFIENNSILPRESGISQKPLEAAKTVPFSSPESMNIEIELPNYGKVSGMGISKGINLITGGGYHGKSTVLNALELGVYNHIPGDGRERVITDPEAVKIRAEDGRNIEKTDISPFISNLPLGKDTKEFCSENASGSTSQAANIIEILEADSSCLLIDEDTSATNFMIRDKRMQELVSKDKEPITPFIDKARQLYNDYSVSSVLVIGGSGDYFGIADKVIAMENYKPYDLTEKAKEIAKQTQRAREGGENFGKINSRAPIRGSIDAQRGKKIKIKSEGVKAIQFGNHRIELYSVEQLVDESQTKAISKAIYYARKYMDGKTSLKDILEKVSEDIKEKGLDIVSPRAGELAGFRKIELASAINRLRSLKVKQLDN